MAHPLKFVKLKTSFKGLLIDAVKTFDEYLTEDPSAFHWVATENPELIARCLEILSDDLPEEDLAELVTRLPYLLFLFHRTDRDLHVPVDASMAFLSILNHAELVTIMRQCSDRANLAEFFNFDSQEWFPVFFMLAGVPDLQARHENETLPQLDFF